MTANAPWWRASCAVAAEVAQFVRPLQRGEPRPPVPPRVPDGRVVNVHGRGEMFIREAGDGSADAPAIVLLHGWTLSADLNWFSGAYEVASRHGVMLAPDVRGHGRGLRSEQPFTLEAAADDVAGLIEHLGLRRAVLVGYSMGGSIALLTWKRHPDVVAGLVLASTALQWRANLVDRVTWLSLAGVEYVLRFGAPRGITDRYLRRAAEKSPDLDQYRGWLKAEVRRGDPTDIAAAGRSLSTFDARDFAGDIDVPTAVVMARKDRMVVEKVQRQLIDAIPGAIEVNLEGAHNAWMVQPLEFAQALDDALTLVLSRDHGPSGPSERETQGPSGPSERETQGPSGPSERETQGPSERRAPANPAATAKVTHL